MKRYELAVHLHSLQTAVLHVRIFYGIGVSDKVPDSVCAAILQHCGYACVLGSFGKGMSLDPLAPAFFGPAGSVELA